MSRLGAAAIALAVLAIAGCGARPQASVRPLHTLCVRVGLPASGPGDQVGRAVLAGLESEIPLSGRSVGGYLIRLCRPLGYPSAEGLTGLLDSAVAAASDRRTIAYVGALSGTEAADAAAVLGPGDIPLITTSGPAPTPTPSGFGAGASPGATPRRTTFYLQPSTARQSAAIHAVAVGRGCSIGASPTRGQRCEVVTHVPLCSGPFPSIPTVTTVVTIASPVRSTRTPLTVTQTSPGQLLCVLAGPDLSGAASPARAYGVATGRVLLDAMSSLAGADGNLASRAQLLGALAGVRDGATPIGPVRFDRAGASLVTRFSVYMVKADGRLARSGTLTTH